MSGCYKVTYFDKGRRPVEEIHGSAAQAITHAAGYIMAGFMDVEAVNMATGYRIGNPQQNNRGRKQA